MIEDLKIVGIVIVTYWTIVTIVEIVKKIVCYAERRKHKKDK